MLPTTLPSARRAASVRGPMLALSALLLAGAGVGFNAAPSFAAAAPAKPTANYSKGFTALAVPLQKSLEDAKARPDVVAGVAKVQAAEAAYNATTAKAARDAAQVQLTAAEAEMLALLDPQVKALDAATAAATTPDDKLAAGQLSIAVGSLARSTAYQRRGVQAMIDSGRAPAEQIPKLQFYIGQFAIQTHDWAGARAALTAATQAGYHADDADALLAEAYISDNQIPQGLTVLQNAIVAEKAAGRVVPEAWYRRGLGASYTARQLDKGTVFAMGLVDAYPSRDNWAAAIDVLRDVAHFPLQEELDLMRLMAHTHSFVDEHDYVEFIQAADARRLPGEVKSVIDAGYADGSIKTPNTFITEARTLANGRVAADRASLPALDREAHGASATGSTVLGAADAFLSYGEAAKAAELYQIALAKPGADANLIHTRLGIADTDAGNYAGAQASFAQITGVRQPLAQLWIIYAKQKAAGKAG